MPLNIQREEISWFPTINYEACLGDRLCYDFCKNGVFSWDEERQRPTVEAALNCVVGCDSCAQLCPSEAITFPSKERLRATLRRLRSERETARGQEAPSTADIP